ncbi:IclR family transcriptional regulator [Nocardia puris]|uniref:IclR family transcriptional regulator n=2 Tax=Nocardia puris TaxID=208602 RepID=A0A366DG60_9NOCA|nr:IclR family transcriptional regulator [Nocardia puris]
MMRGREPSGHEPRAMTRGLQLLEAVAEIGPGATAAQIAAHTGIPRATTYKLLNILVADGYLVRIADLSGFALGIRIQQLARPQHLPDRNAAVLESLRGAVRYGVFLAAFTGDRVRFIDRDPDHDLPGAATMCDHPHASAIGKILLAHRGIARPPLRRLTPRTITDAEVLRAELDGVRDTGIALEVDESRVGRSALAVAVHDDDHRVTGALTVVGKTGRLPATDPTLTELVLEHARSLRIPFDGTVRRTSTPGAATS